MVTQQLTDYIRNQTKQGVDKEAIKAQLSVNGWQPLDIETAFNSVYAENSSIPLATAATPSSVSYHRPHGNKTLLVAIFSIVGLLLIAGSVFAYPYIFAPSPEKVVASMFEQMPEIKSFGYKLGLKSGRAAVGLGSGGSIDYSLDLDGAIDFSDLNSINNYVKFDLKIDTTSPSFQSVFNLGLEERNIGSDVYLKLTEIPTTIPIIIDFSSLLNQWVKLDAESIIRIKLEIEDLIEEFIATDNFVFGEQLLSERNISAEQKKQIAELRTGIVKITDTLPSESINGVSTYHYSFEFDKVALSSAIIEINSILGNEMDEYEIEIFNEGLKSVQFTGGELWIGKEDNLLYKVVINLAIDTINNSSPIQNLSISYEARDYNVPVQIDIPESFKTIEEIMNQPYEATSGFADPLGANQLLAQSRDNQRLSDLAALNSSLALYQTDVDRNISNICPSTKVYSSLSGTRAVDGTGWLPVNFNQISGGSPIPILPIDPINNQSNYYTYGCNPTTQKYELNTVIESVKFAPNMSSDGGNNPNLYEVGTDLNIIGGATGTAEFMSSSRDTKRIRDIRIIQVYVESYYSKCGYYPGIVSGGTCSFTAPTNWTSFASQLGAAIQVTVPSDPSPGKSYWYGWGNNGQSYILGANLENNNAALNDAGELVFAGFTMTSPSANCSVAAPNFGYCVGN